MRGIPAAGNDPSFVEDKEENLSRTILQLVAATPVKLTPLDLERILAGRFGNCRRQIREAVRALVTAQELHYTAHFGRSFLEVSFRRPVRVSRRVVLKPPECHFQGAADDVVISLDAGAAFGSGSHPTTRLAVKGLEFAAASADSGAGLRMLDVGTGSGVLAIAALLLGCRSALGVDIDPCALNEARENVRHNGLENRISITDARLEALPPGFHLVAANLRRPTLLRMAGDLSRLAASGARLVVSGIKAPEIGEIVMEYAEHRFYCIWEEVEQEWAGLVLEQRGGYGKDHESIA